jgi:hypothetical protein
MAKSLCASSDEAALCKQCANMVNMAKTAYISLLELEIDRLVNIDVIEINVGHIDQIIEVGEVPAVRDREFLEDNEVDGYHGCLECEKRVTRDLDLHVVLLVVDSAHKPASQAKSAAAD